MSILIHVEGSSGIEAIRLTPIPNTIQELKSQLVTRLNLTTDQMGVFDSSGIVRDELIDADNPADYVREGLIVVQKASATKELVKKSMNLSEEVELAQTPPKLTLQTTQATNQLSNEMEVSPDERKEALSLKEEGNSLLLAQHHSSAIRKYDEAITLNPYNSIIWSNRGAAYLGLKDYDTAISDLSIAIALDPKYLRSHYRLGLCYANQERYQEALNAFAEALARAGADAVIVERIGEKMNQIRVKMKAAGGNSKPTTTNNANGDQSCSSGASDTVELDAALAEYLQWQEDRSAPLQLPSGTYGSKGSIVVPASSAASSSSYTSFPQLWAAQLEVMSMPSMTSSATTTPPVPVRYGVSCSAPPPPPNQPTVEVNNKSNNFKPKSKKFNKYAKNGPITTSTTATAATTGRASSSPHSQANEVEIEIVFDEDDNAAAIPVAGPVSQKAGLAEPNSTKSQPSPRQSMMVEEMEISEDEPEPPRPVQVLNQHVQPMKPVPAATAAASVPVSSQTKSSLLRAYGDVIKENSKDETMAPIAELSSVTTRELEQRLPHAPTFLLDQFHRMIQQIPLGWLDYESIREVLVVPDPTPRSMSEIKSQVRILCPSNYEHANDLGETHVIMVGPVTYIPYRVDADGLILRSQYKYEFQYASNANARVKMDAIKSRQLRIHDSRLNLTNEIFKLETIKRDYDDLLQTYDELLKRSNRWYVPSSELTNLAERVGASAMKQVRLTAEIAERQICLNKIEDEPIPIVEKEGYITYSRQLEVRLKYGYNYLGGLRYQLIPTPHVAHPRLVDSSATVRVTSDSSKAAPTQADLNPVCGSSDASTNAGAVSGTTSSLTLSSTFIPLSSPSHFLHEQPLGDMERPHAANDAIVGPPTPVPMEIITDDSPTPVATPTADKENELMTDSTAVTTAAASSFLAGDIQIPAPQTSSHPIHPCITCEELYDHTELRCEKCTVINKLSISMHAEPHEVKTPQKVAPPPLQPTMDEITTTTVTTTDSMPPGCVIITSGYESCDSSIPSPSGSSSSIGEVVEVKPRRLLSMDEMDALAELGMVDELKELGVQALLQLVLYRSIDSTQIELVMKFSELEATLKEPECTHEKVKLASKYASGALSVALDACLLAYLPTSDSSTSSRENHRSDGENHPSDGELVDHQGESDEMDEEEEDADATNKYLRSFEGPTEGESHHDPNSSMGGGSNGDPNAPSPFDHGFSGNYTAD